MEIIKSLGKLFKEAKTKILSVGKPQEEEVDYSKVVQRDVPKESAEKLTVQAAIETIGNTLKNTLSIAEHEEGVEFSRGTPTPPPKMAAKKEPVEKEAVSKKTVAKKTVKKKPAVKKSETKTGTTKKAAPKKTAEKKNAADKKTASAKTTTTVKTETGKKKATAKKTASKTTATKTETAKKPVSKKPAAKKSEVKTAATKTGTTKKAAPPKATEKKTAADKKTAPVKKPAASAKTEKGKKKAASEKAAPKKASTKTETKKSTEKKSSKKTAPTKKAEKIALYAKDIKKHYGEVDSDFLEIIVKNLGPSIYKKDAELVSCSDPKELNTVRKNFLMKKLGIDASQKILDAAIQDVCEELKATPTKYRATFYYSLAKKFKKESVLS